eukprot:scaffold6039_cov384-Prasinococcus_capsulatus_cf.AAC.3
MAAALASPAGRRWGGSKQGGRKATKRHTDSPEGQGPAFHSCDDEVLSQIPTASPRREDTTSWTQGIFCVVRGQSRRRRVQEAAHGLDAGDGPTPL